MHCIAWTANEMTRHRHLIDKDELWYEDVTDDRGEAEALADLANGGGEEFLDVEKVKTLKFKNIFKADDENNKNEDDLQSQSSPTRYSTRERQKIPSKYV